LAGGTIDRRKRKIGLDEFSKQTVPRCGVPLCFQDGEKLKPNPGLGTERSIKKGRRRSSKKPSKSRFEGATVERGYEKKDDRKGGVNKQTRKERRNKTTRKRGHASAKNGRTSSVVEDNRRKEGYVWHYRCRNRL